MAETGQIPHARGPFSEADYERALSEDYARAHCTCEIAAGCPVHASAGSQEPAPAETFEIVNEDKELRDGVVLALVKDAEGIIRARVAVDALRTTSCRVTVSDTTAFLDAAEVRALAAALEWAADRSDEVSRLLSSGDGTEGSP